MKIIPIVVFSGILICSIQLFLLLNKSEFSHTEKLNMWANQIVGHHFTALFELDTSWQKIHFNTELIGPKINQEDWDYPWYIVKLDKGFENTRGEPIRKADTTKLIYNSKCFTYSVENQIINNEYRSHLKYANAKIINDTLEIVVSDFSASNSESLSIIIFDNNFKLNYQTTYVFPYKNIEIRYEKSKLTLNAKPPFVERQIVIGDVNLQLIEKIIMPDGKTRSLTHRIVKGEFKVEIK